MGKQKGRYFPNNLKYFRRLNHLTQNDVAWTLQIHYTIISKYESGHIKPDLDTLHALAALYQTTSDELYFERYSHTRSWVVERKMLFWSLKNKEKTTKNSE